MAISGAGAEVTALAESLQAYACATRQYLGEDLKDVSQITSKTTDDADCDRRLTSCLNGLSENWFHSVIVTANLIFEELVSRSSTKYEFYRGGEIVNQIYAEFGKFRAESGVTSDDKWNPADIWMVKKGFKFKGNWPSLKDYNDYLYEQFHAKNLIGISLKLVPKGEAHSEVFNDGKPPTAKFTGFKLSENMTDSKDIYIKYKVKNLDGEIQLRNFSSRPVPSSWQGEIKGKAAAGGKIGGGVVMRAALESGVPENKLDTPQSFASEILKPSDATFKKFASMFKSLSGTRKTIADLIIEAKAGHRKDKTWWMSKYLGISYCYTIQQAGKENAVAKWLFGYGSSATENSSIFIKYS
jgi:hypothetical protein